MGSESGLFSGPRRRREIRDRKAGGPGSSYDGSGSLRLGYLAKDQGVIAYPTAIVGLAKTPFFVLVVFVPAGVDIEQKAHEDHVRHEGRAAEHGTKM